LVFESPSAAWQYANALLPLQRNVLPIKIAGHYGLTHWLEAPLTVAGPPLPALAMIAVHALPGVITVSETFVAALFAHNEQGVRTEPLGEYGDIHLFALKSV
jgi:hypothetical protein